jgi:hypothetical protein
VFSPVPSCGTELPVVAATTGVVTADTRGTLFAVTTVVPTTFVTVEVTAEVVEDNVEVSEDKSPARILSARS